MIAELQEVKKNTKDTAQSTKDTANGMNGFGARVVGVATAHIVEDLGLAFMGGS